VDGEEEKKKKPTFCKKDGLGKKVKNFDTKVLGRIEP
jgi:hypothetical protein